MAAPTGTWEFAYDLMGTRTPQVVTLEATANLETLEGTLLILTGGQVDEAVASVVNPVGLALEKTSGPLSAGAPIKVAIIAPGMVIKGKASADISAGSGFAAKTYDVTAQGLLDAADATNGCLAIHRTENAGIDVWCVLTKHAMFG
jgi:hypothetical protein